MEKVFQRAIRQKSGDLLTKKMIGLSVLSQKHVRGAECMPEPPPLGKSWGGTKCARGKTQV